jgi:hypothetical protein
MPNTQAFHQASNIEEGEMLLSDWAKTIEHASFHNGGATRRCELIDKVLGISVQTTTLDVVPSYLRNVGKMAND